MISRSLALHLTKESGLVIVDARGAIDLNNSPVLRAHLRRLAAGCPALVIFDLSGVSYLDSSGVGTLVEFRRLLDRSAGGRVVLAGLQPRVQSMFEMTKLDRFFTIAPSVEDARRN